MTRAQTIVSTVRHLGPRWAVYRLGYAAQKKCGVFRRATPVQHWDEQPVEQLVHAPQCLGDYQSYRREYGARFFFDSSQRSEFASLCARFDAPAKGDATAGETAVAIAQDVCDGWFRYFESQRVELGQQVDWHQNPFSQQRLPDAGHWSEIDEFGADDIKLIWEPNRFAFVYPLVRAYWRTGDQRYAERFWQLLNGWAEQNSPQQGSNWKCGQEVALRMMAWCFAMYGFADCPSSDSAALTKLLRMVAASATRIAANIQYALSQKNNHGISEAAGLFTAGILFPELSHSQYWRQLGRRHLQNLATELIYQDGAFSQHSANYHRVMLQLYTWCLNLGERNDCRLSDDVYRRVAAAAEFLYQIQDEPSGGLPRYGQYDGALVLPLSTVDQANFRPAIQSAMMVTTGTKVYSAGPHDEELLWLCGPEAINAQVVVKPRQDLSAGQGGCHTLRGEQGFAFVRCGSFRHRPSQADMLHCDIWWRGLNMAIDPGTFSYSAAAPWNNPFSATAYHNTVTVDGQDQMRRASRFLWLPWLHNTAIHRQTAPDESWSYWEGGHDGYQRSGQATDYRRALVRLGQQHWLVLDRLCSARPHRYRMQWLTPDYPLSLQEHDAQAVLQTPLGEYRYAFAASAELTSLEVVRADPESPRGWLAPTYFQRVPGHSITLEAEAEAITLATVLGPGASEWNWQPSHLEVCTTSGTICVEFSPGADRIIKRIIASVSI